MGQDVHNSGLRVVASSFYNLGFDVNIGPLSSTLGEVADLDADSDVHAIGVSSQVAGHLSLLPMLRDELSTRRRRRRTKGGRGRRGGSRIRGRGR